MSLSDCKNGSNTPRSHNYSLHSLPIADTYGKRPVQTFLEFRNTNVPENLDVKHVPMLLFANLQRISKVKVISFLLGLTLTFLIMASYVLMWDKKGLLFTPSPYQLRPAAIPTSTAAARASSKKNLVNMKVLVKVISSTQEHAPRKVPDKKDVIETDSHLFSVIPHHFLPGIKSPCWYEEFSSKPGIDPYRKNLFTLHSKSFKTVCDRLRANFNQHLYHRDGKDFRLRCLPYFYIIGQPKCGTTDLFHRLLLHPEVRFNIMKEPHWWTRKRFGYIRFKDGFQENFPVEDYLDLFDLAANNIQQGITGNSSGHHRALQLITGSLSSQRNLDHNSNEFFPNFCSISSLDHFQEVALDSEVLQYSSEELEGNNVGIIQDVFCGIEQAGEASASTMWDNQAWSYLHPDEEETEPPFLAQDFIHAVQPDAKIIIMLRDPIERLYSDYLYFKMANKSAEDFHQKVTESVQLFQSCVAKRSLRSCVYNTSLSNNMPVRLNLGVYIVFLLDWLTVFNKEQILVLRLEDYAANLKETIKKVFDFLSVGPLSEQAEAALTKQPMSNTRRVEDRNLGPMFPATRDLLRRFHQPFNRKLGNLLNNKGFLWSNT